MGTQSVLHYCIPYTVPYVVAWRVHPQKLNYCKHRGEADHNCYWSAWPLCISFYTFHLFSRCCGTNMDQIKGRLTEDVVEYVDSTTLHQSNKRTARRLHIHGNKFPQALICMLPSRQSGGRTPVAIMSINSNKVAFIYKDRNKNTKKKVATVTSYSQLFWFCSGQTWYLLLWLGMSIYSNLTIYWEKKKRNIPKSLDTSS